MFRNVDLENLVLLSLSIKMGVILITEVVFKDYLF